MNKRCDRRTFLKNSIAASAAVGLTASSGLLSKTAAWLSDPVNNPMPKRPLGKTGHDVSIFSLGGQATIEQPGRHEHAVEIINRAIDLGVNYIDTANQYGGGVSEEYIGMVMKERRDEVFLATKSHDYSYDGTMRMIEESLKRLQTDYIDLYQHHYVGGHGQLSQLQQGNPSARQAFEELKDQGVIGHIGISGHSSKIMVEAIEDYPYETVLITLNPDRAIMNDAEYLDRFFELTQEREIGVIAMKLISRGSLLDRGFTIQQLLNYSMSYPISTAIVGISEVAQLEENIRIARAFQQLSEEEMEAIRAAHEN